MLTQLLYVSVSDISPDSLTLDNEIAQILSSSYVYNERSGVTGVLLYCGGYYCQLLEGEVTAIDDVFNRIQSDKRHRDLNVLLKRSTDWMLLPQYPMGCAGIERTPDPVIVDAVGLRGWTSVSEVAPAVLYSLLSRVPDTDLVLEDPHQLIKDEIQL